MLLYISDLIIRMIYVYKSYCATLEIFDFKKFNTTYIFLSVETVEEYINVKPGCYFFIACKNLSILQWHPISLVSKDHNKLLFCIKDTGKNTWSNNLKKIQNVDIEISLQGPYSHLNLDYDTNKYRYIVGITNGIGVTPFFSILNDINKLYRDNKIYNLEKFMFIWIVPSECFIIPFLNNFENLDKNIFDIYIYTTKVVEDEDEYINILDVNKFSIIKGIKPNIMDCLDNFIKTNNIKKKEEMSLISCGSSNLTNDIYKACSKLDIHNIVNENF